MREPLSMWCQYDCFTKEGCSKENVKILKVLNENLHEVWNRPTFIPVSNIWRENNQNEVMNDSKSEMETVEGAIQ